MSDDTRRRVVRIARTERRRHRRAVDDSRSLRYLRHGSRLAVAFALAIGAYALGRELAAGTGTGSIPRGELALVAAVVVVATAWRSGRTFHTRFERIRPEFLLTTVSERTAAFGLLAFVAVRVAASLAAPTIGAAVGLAIGLRSPAVAFTATLAVGALAAVAIVGGCALRLGAHLAARRLARGRGRTLRDLLVALGWLPLLGGWLFLRTTSYSMAPVFAALESGPLSWPVDLALLGATGGSVRAATEPTHALAALAVLSFAVVPFVSATVALAGRSWVRDGETTRSSVVDDSRTLTDEPRLERLFGGRVSRPVRAVARKCWLAERRVHRGLLVAAYAFAFGALILLPIFGILGAPLFLWFVATLGLALGIAVGGQPVETEYQGLPMLLTTIDGRTYVHGTLLAGLLVGAPIVAAVVVPVGVLAPPTLAETAALAVAGVAICGCTAAVGLAVELTVDRAELGPVPSFFTDITVYAETGSSPFRRLGTIFAIASCTLLPAVVGNVPFVYDAGLLIGLSSEAVRVGSLLTTALAALVVSSVASRLAIGRYDEYRLG
ncbi:hypothetical protein [Natronolimnohabitans innermongolicus]|uniref:ABC-2 type transport system permease protein n=1 Tax=Natronolimnohabitans innermongolicus JCM 12255 TaxID=1227499 RepID=L9WVP5_9EURY|nr:hypothetical protein [Natronolimnohabitans innermongolicus]ELY53271.1 hypothetical protein C493_14613 [Natronolimnohabitans innermongolicus JCM 12255]